ncbi:MAG: hypothetical protein M0Z56_13410, partial [Desulfobacteraceae bacterium]|nr:hypothetical protein [Desulfobacteraceae bacterium]
NIFHPLKQIIIIFGIFRFLKVFFQDFFKTLRQEHFFFSLLLIPTFLLTTHKAISAYNNRQFVNFVKGEKDEIV